MWNLATEKRRLKLVLKVIKNFKTQKELSIKSSYKNDEIK